MKIIEKIENELILINQYLRGITKEIKIMSEATERLEALQASLILGVNEIASDLQALKDLLTGAPTEEELNLIADKFQLSINRLNALGQEQ